MKGGYMKVKTQFFGTLSGDELSLARLAYVMEDAAAYNLEWNTHWSTTLSFLDTPIYETLSSDKTANPKLVINVSIP